MSDCDKEYGAYGGESTTDAVVQGVANGIMGLTGFGGFLGSPTDDSALTDLKTDFNTLKQKWSEITDTQRNQYTKDQQLFAKQQLEFITATENFHDELLNEKIGELGLGEGFLIAFLVVIIIYLVIS